MIPRLVTILAGLLVLLPLSTGAYADQGDGVSLTTSRASYTYVGDFRGGGVVQMTIHDAGTVPILLGNSAPFFINDTKQTVFVPGSLQTSVEIFPGGSYTVAWDLRTNCDPTSATDANCLAVALPGAYTATWSYALDAPGALTKTISVQFSIEAA